VKFNYRWIVSLIKSQAIKWGLTAIIGSATGGIYAWAVKLGLVKLWDRWIGPELFEVGRWFKTMIRTKELKKKGKKTVDAKTGGEHDEAVDDLFS